MDTHLWGHYVTPFLPGTVGRETFPGEKGSHQALLRPPREGSHKAHVCDSLGKGVTNRKGVTK
jgi:hypothetical protein